MLCLISVSPVSPSPQPDEVRALIPISQRRKLRLGEGKGHVWGEASSNPVNEYAPPTAPGWEGGIQREKPAALFLPVGVLCFSFPPLSPQNSR